MKTLTIDTGVMFENVNLSLYVGFENSVIIFEITTDGKRYIVIRRRCIELKSLSKENESAHTHADLSLCKDCPS